METTALFRLLRGAVRSVQLYPPDSPVVSRSIAALHRAVAELATGRPEGVSVSFLDDGSYVDGRPVRPVTPGDDDGSPGDFYAVGLRELRFLDEVTVEEVEGLLRPLARAMLGQLNPVDEDLSLQLWEANLPHIAYLLYEESLPSEPEAAAEVTVPAPDPGIDAFLAEGSPFPGEASGIHGFRLAEEERMRILAAFRREEEPDLPFKFGRLLLEVLRSEPGEREAAGVAGVLRDHLSALAQQGRALVWRRLRERVEPQVAASPAASRALAEIEAFLREPAVILGLLRAESARSEDREAVALLAGEVPPPSAYALLSELEDNPEALGSAVAEALRSRLARDHDLQLLAVTGSRPTLRRVALERFVPQTDEVRHLRELQQQEDPGWRLLAATALARGKDPAHLTALADALDDPGAEIRMFAAEALGRHGGPAALEPLLRRLASRGFHRRSIEERRSVLLAAGRAAPREVWPVLARLAERRRRFLLFRRGHANEPALEVLAQLPEPIPTLLHDRWRGRPDLRSALAQLSARAAAGSPGETAPGGPVPESRAKAA